MRFMRHSTHRRTFARDAEVGRDLELRIRDDLRRRRWLRVHVLLIAGLTLAGCWLFAWALMQAGVESMAWRHGLALAAAYVWYLGLMWVWSHWLLSRNDETGEVGNFDVDPADAIDGVEQLGRMATRMQRGADLVSGGGGDFAGGGASGSWDMAESTGKAMAEGGSKALEGVAEAVGAVDEGSVVVIPLLVVVGGFMLIGAAVSFAVLGVFGVDVLLGVAVEVAFASAGGAVALLARRQGWLLHAVGRTATPMAIVLACSVAAGAALDHWIPEAKTYREAVHLIVDQAKDRRMHIKQ